MKSVLFVSIWFAASIAQAGTVGPKTICNGGNGSIEYRWSYAEGFVASAQQSFLGNVRFSGDIQAEIKSTTDKTGMILFSDDDSFQVTVIPIKMNSDGYPIQANISGHFRDLGVGGTQIGLLNAGVYTCTTSL